jgi:ribonuclease J
MELIIHRGSKEIGGNCVEVSAGGPRLILDVGLPLVTP